MKLLAITASIGAMVLASSYSSAAAVSSPTIERDLHYTDRGHAYIGVDLNDELGYPMILDTAANVGVLPNQLKQELDLSGDQLISREVQGAAGKTILEMARLDNTAVADLSYSGLTYVFQDLNSLELETGQLPGIVGHNFMSRHCVAFDFTSSRLAMNPGECDEALTQGLRESRFILDRNFIKLTTYFNGEEVDALLDTGAPESYINSPLHAITGQQIVDTDEAKGLNDQSVEKGKIESLNYRLGEHDIEEPFAYVSDMPVFAALGYGDKPVLVLGLDIFKQNKLVIDYANNRIYF
ncbi:MAG: pepsin/retropepsin-like aspartic protease family protein [Pseudomonadales bacterium]|jgi:predicted aspartyl protease